jgi:hypothetical protein
MNRVPRNAQAVYKKKITEKIAAGVRHLAVKLTKTGTINNPASLSWFYTVHKSFALCRFFRSTM